MGLLRVLLAMAVIISHCGGIPFLRPVSGSTAVEAFFIISGFYMSLILQEKYCNKPYLLFITSRFLRLYPIYWTVLIATCLFSLVVYLSSDGQRFPLFDIYLSVKPAVTAFSFLLLSNLLIAGQDAVMFMGISRGTGQLYFTGNFWNSDPPLFQFLLIPQAWSLGLELLFYLLAPFILKKGLKWMIVLMAFSFALRFYLYNYLGCRNDPWTYRFFPTELLFFLSGNLSYRLYKKIRKRKIPTYISTSLLFFILLATTAYAYIPSFKQDCMPFSWNECFYFISVMTTVPLLFHFLKDRSWDNHIGELSYPMYISHLLIARITAVLPFPWLRQSWCIALITMGFSCLLVIAIARPLEKYRQARIATAGPRRTSALRPFPQ